MGVLALLSNPVARYVGIALVAILVVGWLRHDAAQDARRAAETACIQAAQEAAAKERERLQRAGQAALDEAQRRAEEAEERMRELEDETDDLLEQLDRSSARCPIPRDVLRRLRDIQ
jgi:flagellar motility protein MotE (MotC chaperone)